MGAHNFRDAATAQVMDVPGGLVADMQRAYTTLAEEAAHEDGHSAYSGTIATTNGVKLFTDFPVTSKEDLYKAERIILDRTQKWEHCEAVLLEDTWYFIGWAAS